MQGRSTENKKVLEVRRLYIAGKTRKEISSRLNLKYITVCQILAHRGRYKKQGRRKGEVELDVY